MERLTENLYPVSTKTVNGTRWGYINDRGRTRISLVYDGAEPFQKNGFAIVTLNEKQGLINQFGRFAVKPVYKSIQPFSEERAIIQTKDGFKMIDEEGHVRTKKTYAYMAPMKHGRALFQTNGRYGFLNSDGEEVIAARYLFAFDFDEGKAVVQTKTAEFQLIDENGHVLHTYPYADVGSLSEGRIAFKQGDLYGYLDEAGNVVIPPKYGMAFAYEDGFAIIATNGDNYSYGLINKAGNTVFEPVYNEIRLLQEGRVALGKAKDANRPFLSRYAIANTSGAVLTDFVYDDIGSFKKGTASAVKDDKTFFIDKEGHKAKTFPAFSGTGVLRKENGIVAAFIDQRLFYTDEHGKIIWHPDTEIRLRRPYRIQERLYKRGPNYYVYYPQIEGMANQLEQQAINQKLAKQAGVCDVTEAETKERTFTGDFNVLFFKKHLVVLEIDGYTYPFGAAHGMPTRTFANVDIRNGHDYALSELFKHGRDYAAVLSKLVGEQIQNQADDYFPNAYKGVKSTQPFYVDEHALYLVFDVYELAPYAAGFPTFKIPFAEIEPIIDQSGPFWQSFHYHNQPN
ncbi:WG repeat-containing protein [Shouchella clausii]|uniref:WG repeat-containing protein n=1 Tax=Shouchella clausii TaxID=79880 RepID=UPI0015CB9A8B|nr:WG repeat-containing protein [Shouchella clausii]